MNVLGLDLGGGSSVSCVCDERGAMSYGKSRFPDKPASVLLPLVRGEDTAAGELALASDRGGGGVWPPLVQTGDISEAEESVEAAHGRLLIAAAWHRLAESTVWHDTHWSPPDDLPRLHKPSPAECIALEAKSHLVGNAREAFHSTKVVIAVPNSVPEEGQQALLDQLPPDTRLVWRSVAAAICHLEGKSARQFPDDSLVVLDVGPSSIERSVFTLRDAPSKSGPVLCPVRKTIGQHRWPVHTGFFSSALSANGFRFNPQNLSRVVDDVLESCGPRVVLVCGPGAQAFREAVHAKNRGISIVHAPVEAIARGAAVYGWRIGLGIPTYFDQLQSLELFTITQARERRWQVLIPPDQEIAGGEVYHKLRSRIVFIERSAAGVSFWLQRSGENGFRFLETRLPSVASSDTWTDLEINAAAAGGFASVRMKPSLREPQIFGPGNSVQLDWLNMRRVEKGPKQEWPPIQIKYGWPACGKLFACEQILIAFLDAAETWESALEAGTVERQLGALNGLKVFARATRAPRFIGITDTGDGGAPIAQLLTFGTDCPVEIAEALPSGKAHIVQDKGWKHDRAVAIANTLWGRLSRHRCPPIELKGLIYVLGRMGGYAPMAFSDFIATHLSATSTGNVLFAAGRVLRTSAHGRALFLAIYNRSRHGERLNNSWLRAVIYATYQQEEMLAEVPRQHLVAAFRFTLEELQRYVSERNTRVGFTNCLRALSLLLRSRRYPNTRNFVLPDECPPEEQRLLLATRQTLGEAQRLHLTEQRSSLVKRLLEWLEFSSDTDVLPPIADDDDASSTDDD